MRSLAVLTLFAACVSATPSTFAQDDRPDVAVTGPGIDAPAPERLTSTGEVEIKLASLGVGNVARLGDWVGVRVLIADAGSRQREVLVRLSMPDSDGDTTHQQVEVTTNPGVQQSVWLYGRLAHTEFGRDQVMITVHEAIEAEGPGERAPREDVFRPGRLLGRLEVQLKQGNTVPDTVGLVGMLGDRDLGLRQYSARPGSGSGGGAPQAVMGHELTEIVTGLRPAELPDRWLGLLPFETIVWGQGEITELREERAAAIREWVERGGHLVIVLPPVAQMWSNPASNPLHSIMPSVVIGRRENVDLLPYRPLLTNRIDGPYPKAGIVHTFGANPQAAPSEGIPILSNADGECVVVRRLVGMGMVTLVGIDINQTAFSQFQMVDADIFWNRVLGRRGNFQNRSEAVKQSPRREWFVDRVIADQINVTGRSFLGALAGFTLFSVYWLAVGPPLYFVLKRRDLHRFAWLAFGAGTLAFTVLAWGAATALRPTRVEATHFTVLDHVYGQPVQRARGWFSVLVPWYGDARVTVGDASGEMERSLSCLAPWDGPGDERTGGSFPDARGYPVNARSPDAMSFPVRATVKQLRADWVGPPVWRMIRPVNPADGTEGTLKVVERTQGAQKSEPSLDGWLVHSLPGLIEDGYVVVVRRQERITGNPSIALPAVAEAYLLPPTGWKPDEPLSMSVLTRLDGAPPALVTTLRSKSTLTDMVGFGPVTGGSLEDRLFVLSFFHHLEPPTYGNSMSSTVEQIAAQRQSMHTLDLSRWLTQPCVIVTGWLRDDSATPIPLYVDGQELPTRGKTFVRWVYPLPASPPPVGKPEDQRRPKRAGEGAAADEQSVEQPEDEGADGGE